MGINVFRITSSTYIFCPTMIFLFYIFNIVLIQILDFIHSLFTNPTRLRMSKTCNIHYFSHVSHHPNFSKIPTKTLVRTIRMMYHPASSSVLTNRWYWRFLVLYCWCDLMAKATWDFNGMHVVVVGVMVVESMWAMLVICRLSKSGQVMHWQCVGITMGTNFTSHRVMSHQWGGKEVAPLSVVTTFCMVLADVQR